jgi:hypothetical protein
LVQACVEAGDVPSALRVMNSANLLALPKVRGLGGVDGISHGEVESETLSKSWERLHTLHERCAT